MPDGPAPVPMALVFDLEAVREELWGTASVVAMQMATSSGWKPNDRDVSTVALEYIGKFFNPIDTYNGAFVSHGSQQVTTDNARFVQLRKSNYDTFVKGFVAAAALGPIQALAYLTQKRHQRDYSQRALSELFRNTQYANDMAIAALNTGINRCFAIKVAANVAATVAGAGVGTLAASLAWGAGYSIVTAIAESVGQAEAADLVAYVKPTIFGSMASAFQSGTDQVGKGVDDELVKAAKAQAARAEERLARLRGGRVVRAMGRSGQKMLERAEQRAANAAATSSRVGAANATGKVFSALGKGAAIGVGLWFMREDLAKVGHWITTGEGFVEQEEAARRARRH